MIVYERPDDFVMIKQHDHAQLSAEVARYVINQEAFLNSGRKEDALYSILEHDRGWIDLDDVPLWNDRDQSPYSFMDFPSLLKLTFYKKGIDEVERVNRYAALLCSLHFVSFYEGDDEETSNKFVRDEKSRQEEIKKEQGITTREEKEELALYFDLLQFCDNVSLYVCLNEPGVKKSEELSWYRQGFPQLFPFVGREKIMPRWVGEEKVVLSPFPLEREIEASVRIKEVKKVDIERLGIAQAYKETAYRNRTVTFVKNSRN
jgi:hypothetical protein